MVSTLHPKDFLRGLFGKGIAGFFQLRRDETHESGEQICFFASNLAVRSSKDLIAGNKHFLLFPQISDCCRGRQKSQSFTTKIVELG